MDWILTTCGYAQNSTHNACYYFYLMYARQIKHMCDQKLLPLQAFVLIGFCYYKYKNILFHTYLHDMSSSLL